MNEELRSIERRVSRLEMLLYVLLGSVVGLHFIDPIIHIGVLQFP